MNVVFVHDHKFRLIDGKIYSPGGLSNEVLTRYADWFGKVDVIGRIIKQEELGNSYSLIENPDVTVQNNEKLEELIKNADAVISRLPSINGYKAIYYAKKYNKPYITELVGCVWDAYINYGIKGKLTAAPSYLLVRYLVKKSPNVLYVTNKFLQKRYPTANNQVAVSDVALESTNSEVLKRRLEKISNKKEKLILGTAAAVDVAYKGQEYVIRAIPEIEKKLGVEVEYQLAGGGNTEPLTAVAEECSVKDKVVFMGALPHDKMFDWLDSIDIYVQSSMLEGLSRALLEAMSRGLPCIAVNCGGNPELIDSRCLVEKSPKSKLPSAICEKTQLICENAELWAKRNYRLANEEYDQKLLNERRENFYKSFIENL